MTERERREQTAALKGEIRSTHEQLTAALRSMDYGAALSCQMKIDHLQKVAFRLEPVRGQLSTADD